MNSDLIEIFDDEDESNSQPCGIKVGIDWKEAKHLSEFGKQKQIFSDGNCGFRSLLVGLQKKGLIGSDKKDGIGQRIDAFYLCKLIYSFEKDHKSWVTQGEDKRDTGLQCPSNHFQDQVKSM
jgi:hypothetical protein